MVTTTKYIYNGFQYVGEADENGALTRRFVNEPDAYTHLIGAHDVASGGNHAYHYDAIGSTREVTDDAEVVTDEFTYDTAGNRLSRAGTSNVSFQYAGAYGYSREEETETYYVMARTYDPQSLRWLSVDPLGLSEGINLYRYVRNRFVIFIDPSGEILKLAEGTDTDDALKQLQTLCPDAGLEEKELTVTAKKSVENTKFPESCDCICDAIKAKDRTITIKVIEMTESGELPITIHAANSAFANGVNGACKTGDKAPGPNPWPHTTGDSSTVVSPSSKSKWKFGAFLKDGKSFAFRANYIVLGHELCGHAWPELPKEEHRGEPSWNRPHHDDTIDIENKIAAEHGDKNVRGHFKDKLGCGESASYHTTEKIWYRPEACLPKGLTYPAQP